jgi:hypothetical protein
MENSSISLEPALSSNNNYQYNLSDSDCEHKIVTLGSPEYKIFIKKIENNYNAQSKVSACLLCWGFIAYYQKIRHKEHSHYTVTPAYFKDETHFLSLAKKHGKLSDNDTKVAIFADQCKITDSTFTNGPSRSLSFGP